MNENVTQEHTTPVRVFEVHFGNDKYHLQEEMISWCKQYVGLGGWLWGSPKDPRGWGVHSMFGNTTFVFKEQKHANWFTMRWL